jgi:predicted 3-demethylubiquinone-9 3-methyltransferase (glyoxalase superfamily)
VRRSAVTTALIFQGGEAEEAMRFSIDVFGDGEIEQISRYQAAVRVGERSLRRVVAAVSRARVAFAALPQEASP